MKIACEVGFTSSYGSALILYTAIMFVFESIVTVSIFSASLSSNIASVSANGVVDLSSIPSVGRSVGRSVCLRVRKVYCGKTAHWIRMLFGMVRRSVEGCVY